MDIVTFGREKETGRSTKQFEGLFELFKEAAGTDSPLRIGVLGKDKHEGPMIEEWASFLSAHAGEFESVDSSLGVSMCLSIKDADESVSVLKAKGGEGSVLHFSLFKKLIAMAAKTSAVVMKEHVMNKILSVIDEGRKVSHSKLSEDIESVVTGQLKRFKTKLPPTLDTELVDICYPPIIQSGGNYSLKPSALSNDDSLHFGIVLCSLGVRYKSYCSNIARTFLIDPSKVI